MSLSGVSKMAGEELWPELRAKRMELKLRESGANELLLEAIKDEGQLLQRSRQTAENAVIAANLIIEAVTANTDGVKDSSRATTLNNVCFALANLGRFIESIGIVGIAGRVKNAKNQGETPSGQPWEKGMLQQINVTVKNIQAEGERLAKQAGSSTDVDVG